MIAKIYATIAVFITGSLLIYGVSDFPRFGDARSPANAGVEGGAGSISEYYITKSYADTKVPNIVTSVLADYRSYDTMFETVVIFVAGMSIFAILRTLRSGAPLVENFRKDDSFIDGDHQRIIVGTTCRLAVPVVQLFALYVIAHGHHSPGGGFQGGVLLGASYIILALADDLAAALRRLSEARYLMLAAVGIAIYSGLGFLCMLLGQNFLDYGVLEAVFRTDGPEMARSHSMLGVEIGVAATVMAIMFAIYANLASKGTLKKAL